MLTYGQGVLARVLAIVDVKRVLARLRRILARERQSRALRHRVFMPGESERKLQISLCS